MRTVVHIRECSTAPVPQYIYDHASLCGLTALGAWAPHQREHTCVYKSRRPDSNRGPPTRRQTRESPPKGLKASLAAGRSASELHPVCSTRRAPDSKIHGPTSSVFFRAADWKDTHTDICQSPIVQWLRREALAFMESPRPSMLVQFLRTLRRGGFVIFRVGGGRGRGVA